ncbi:MAG: trigger factor [Rubrivivax sp.]|jgi:trigger factor
MAVNVEVLEKLQRRVTLTLSASEIAAEVDTRLKKLSRTVKAAGFRPGKVPMSVVAQRYGYSVQYEVVNDRVGKAFADAAQEASLRVAGTPRIEQNDQAPEGHLAFDATFEVYPEVRIGDLSACEIERVTSEVTDEAIDRTVDILRRQRRTFAQRPASDGAQETDRVTIDFSGTIDGTPFAGGQAKGFQFIIGEGQMLPQFDQAVRGMRVGDSKTFPLQFPADYHGQDVAGKEADFLVTMNKIEAAQLPDVDEAFVRSLGIADGSVDALRVDVRRNLERELKFRVMARNKAAVLDALVKVSELELPKALVDDEVERLTESTRADLRERGVKDADKVGLPAEMFSAQAERRVRLGLIMSELVRAEGLRAKPDQLQKHLEEISQSYEKPAEVMRHYLGDRQRMAEVEAVVVENNVTEHVLARARVSEKVLPFDQVMAAA